MRLWQFPPIRAFINFFLKLALTRPGKFIMGLFAKLDPIIYRLTGGLFIATGPAIFPMAALTTMGRKSGQKRTVQLACVAFDDHAYVVASNFGKGKHPAWMYNIEADPNVSIQIGSKHYAVAAERLTEAEKAEVWDRLVDQVPNFAEYEKQSGRTLRVYRMHVPGVEATI